MGAKDPRRTRGGSDSSSDTGVLERGTLVLDRYEIIRILGSGGFGTVYSAVDRILKKEVALKFLSPEVIDNEKKFIRVKREINISQKITDKSIVKIFSLENWKGKYFLIMEMVKGRTLKEITEEKGKLRWDEFGNIFINILKAVSVLHENGIIHRDIKPSNIMISADGSAKLLDFGLSKEMGDLEKTSSIGEVVGSPYYMSPEQVSMKDVDHRSDIYQLGLVLYETLSGKLPFSDETSTLDLLYKRVSGEPESFSKLGVRVPDFLEFGIQRAMEREKKNRFSTVEEMISYFEQEHYPFMGKTIAKVRKHPVKTFIIILLIFTVSLSAYYVMKNSNSIGTVEFSGSKLRVSNKFGVELFEKDFKPYNILKPVILRISKDHGKLTNRYARDNYPASDSDIISLFLIKKDLYSSIIRESVYSDKYASEVCFVDKKGKILHKEFFHMSGRFLSKNEFSGWMNFQRIKKEDEDLDGVEELIFETCHNMSMFPAQFVILDKSSIYKLYNPGHFNQIYPQKKKGRYDFLIFGRNNPLSHMSFIADIDLKKTEQFALFPNLNFHPGGIFLDYFYVVLPTYLRIVENRWKESGYLILTDLKEKSEITLRKDYSLTVTKDGKSALYRDPKNILKGVYTILNEVYLEKMRNKDFKEADKLLKKIDVKKVKNPYLLSVIYQYKGDIDISLGKYKKGERSLDQALHHYKNNMDAIQRRCESAFLQGKLRKFAGKVDGFSGEGVNFFGLGKDGERIFGAYTNLNEGCFREAEKITGMLKKGKTFLKGQTGIFLGKYYKVFTLLKKKIGERTTPFTLEEVRLMFARAVLLSTIFSESENAPDDESVKLSKFYFKDIADNSYMNDYLADLSAAYFMLDSEDSEDLHDYTKGIFDKLLSLSGGNIMAKLWLFYDSFIYARIMEKLNDIKEAIRGYKLCIKANPHTDLAKRATKRLKKLRL